LTDDTFDPHVSSPNAPCYLLPVTDAERTVAFFEAWGVSFDAMVASFYDNFAPACLWEQRPLSVTTGPDEAVRFLHRAKVGMGLATVDVELRHVTSSDNLVFTERFDHLQDGDGRLIVTAPVAGVLEWHNGSITAWREYFDAASFVGRAFPRLVSGVARRAVAPRRRR
jgi:limonene-1,2-epoxide hydrolase